jgi:hypothetical protein
MAIGTLFSTRGALKVFCTLSPRNKRTEKRAYKQAAMRDNPMILPFPFIP